MPCRFWKMSCCLLRMLAACRLKVNNPPLQHGTALEAGADKRSIALKIRVCYVRSHPMSVVLRRILPSLLMLLLFVGAVWVLHRELRGYGYREVIDAFSAISNTQLGLALVLTALSYLVLTGYDALALRYLKKKLDYGRTALTSFVGYVF